MYPGTMLFAHSCDLSAVRKVKAHVADSPDLTAQERWEKFGNDAADRAARLGLLAHPTGSKAELDEVDRK
eukprot:6994614-Pyramimonas_sp.AAC.1